MVKTPHFHCRGAQIQSLVGEIGSCLLEAWPPPKQFNFFFFFNFLATLHGM